MIIVRVVIGTVKVLMVLGVVEYIAPGLSHEVTRKLVDSMFAGMGGK
jgi:hypothetical protein